MMFRLPSSVLSLWLALPFVAAGAHSAPITFAIDPSSTIQVGFEGSAALGSSIGSGGIHGTVQVDLAGGT